MTFTVGSPLPVKKNWRVFVTSAVEHKHWAIENTPVIIMATGENSSCSEEILSNENSSYECNLYDSDVGKLSETGVDVRARPFRFEPRRVPHDMQPESNEEDRLVNVSCCDSLTLI